MPEISDLQRDNKALARQSIRATLEKQAVQLKDALPPNISTKRFLRVVFTQLHTNPVLQKCSKESLLASVFKAAERGLMPNGRHGALVPYWNSHKRTNEAQFQEMYQGLIHLARKSGDIADIVPATIYENDEWSYELGMHMDLRHKPALSNRGEPIAYYAVILFPDGRKSFGPGPMSKEAIDAIRARSKAKSGPWDTDYEPMAWKTVIKRNLKYIGASAALEEHLIEDDNIEYGSISVTQPVYEDESDVVDAEMPPGRIEQSPEPVPEWPKWDQDTQEWLDSSGAAYREELHSKPMKVNTDGTFRKRRVVEKREPDPVRQKMDEEAVASEVGIPPEMPSGAPGEDVPFAPKHYVEGG